MTNYIGTSQVHTDRAIIGTKAPVMINELVSPLEHVAWPVLFALSSLQSRLAATHRTEALEYPGPLVTHPQLFVWSR